MYNKNFSVKRGETFYKDVYFKVDDKPYNLNGYTAKAQIRPFLESKKLIAELQCTIYEEQGMIHLELSKEQTNNIPANIYYYDLCLSKDDINIYYLQGKFIVEKYITEPPNV